MDRLFGGYRNVATSVKIVATNKSHEEFSKSNLSTLNHPLHSPARKIRLALDEVKVRIQVRPQRTIAPQHLPRYAYTTLSSFREFIEKEMDPAPDEDI